MCQPPQASVAVSEQVILYQIIDNCRTLVYNPTYPFNDYSNFMKSNVDMTGVG